MFFVEGALAFGKVYFFYNNFIGGFLFGNLMLGLFFPLSV
jgi:hypothetical protein